MYKFLSLINKKSIDTQTNTEITLDNVQAKIETLESSVYPLLQKCKNLGTTNTTRQEIQAMSDDIKGIKEIINHQDRQIRNNKHTIIELPIRELQKDVKRLQCNIDTLNKQFFTPVLVSKTSPTPHKSDIRQNADKKTLASCRNTQSFDVTSKDSLEDKIKQLMGHRFIGLNEWKALFGKDAILKEAIPNLPENIMDILKQKCLIEHGKAVSDTHLLFLLPEKLNGEPLTMVRWHEILTQHNHQSNYQEAKFSDKWWKGWQDIASVTSSPSNPEWILMPKQVIPSSNDKTLEQQIHHLTTHYQGYKLTNALELSTGIFLYYLQTGKKLNIKARTLREFNHPIVHLGPFDSTGLYISADWDNFKSASGIFARITFNSE